MNSEAAVVVGQHLAASIRDARFSEVTEEILSNLDRLLMASGTTAMDALAFLAVARKLLCVGIDASAIDTTVPTETLIAMHLVWRAVEALEIATGYGAESFTGEVETVN